MFDLANLKAPKSVFILFMDNEDVTLENQPKMTLQGGRDYLKRLACALEDVLGKKVGQIVVDVDQERPGYYRVTAIVGDDLVIRVLLVKSKNY